MNVGIYIDQMSKRGGAQRVVSNLCYGWTKLGWRVHLIVVSGDTSAFSIPVSVIRHQLAENDKRRGFLGLWDNWKNIKALGALIRKEELEAVYSVSTVANIHLAYADLPKVVVRVGSEHCYLPHFPLPCHKEWFRRKAYRRLDAVVCPTDESAAYLSSNYPGTRSKCIPNWLTWPMPKSDGEGAPVIRRAGRKVFVTCGRFDKLKGFSRLIAMFAGLRHRLPDWDLVIVGDGEDKALLEAQIAHAQLQDRISLPGWIADMETIYRSADLFLFPSVSEGFALVLAEAMACGLPCVSYDCKVGPAEIIRNGIDGLLVPVGDEAAFSLAMVRLAENVSIRQQMASASPGILARLSEEAVQPLWAEVLSVKR